MAQEHPAWLDASFVQKILRGFEKDDSIEVSGITINAATAKGDNYGSDMHRVTAKFSRVQNGRSIEEIKSLLAKVAPEGNLRAELIEDMRAFETELSMMSATLLRMNEILKDIGLPALSGRCVYFQYEKPTHVIIEDLAPKGFRMAKRQAGLDLDHCLMTVRNLGRFHAASIALKEKDPKAFTKYTKPILHKDQPAGLVNFYNSGAKSLLEEAAKWPELSPRIVEKLQKLSDVLWEKGCEAQLFREDDFNVLNHGDCWVNNMLFLYDGQQKPIDHRFVDFQISNYGSPAIDLLTFLGTSPTNEIRMGQRELVLREYYDSLSSTMAKLKCATEVLSFDNLRETLRIRAFSEVVVAVTGLPLIAFEKSEEIDFEEIIKQDGEYKNPGCRGESCRKIMTKLLPWYDSMGLLDV